MRKLVCFLTLIHCTVFGQFVGTTTASGVVSDLPYTFDILTLEEDDSFTPPLYDGGTYNFNIDWGDGNDDDITAWNDGDLTHTYADAGASTYNIVITGTLVGWRFDNGGDDLLMKVITQWGCLNFGNTGDAFKGCNNMTITATDEPSLAGITDLNETFQLCTSLTTVPGMGDWNVSNVTTFYGMFHSNTLFSQDISGWDTSSCINMGYMFYNCDAFNVDISGWDVSNVNTMTWMFYNNDGFNQNIGGWDTGSVGNIIRMFNGATAFDQDISSWDLSQITDLTAMFNGATSFDQSLATLDISTITDMTNMFNGVTLSVANYSAMLIGWEGQNEQANVTFHGSEGKYNAGAVAARAALVTNGWDITDGGQE